MGPTHIISLPHNQTLSFPALLPSLLSRRRSSPWPALPTAPVAAGPPAAMARPARHRLSPPSSPLPVLSPPPTPPVPVASPAFSLQRATKDYQSLNPTRRRRRPATLPRSCEMARRASRLPSVARVGRSSSLDFTPHEALPSLFFSSSVSLSGHVQALNQHGLLAFG